MDELVSYAKMLGLEDATAFLASADSQLDSDLVDTLKEYIKIQQEALAAIDKEARGFCEDYLLSLKLGTTNFQKKVESILLGTPSETKRKASPSFIAPSKKAAGALRTLNNAVRLF
eukprot:TRINITY_DN32171_c0_g1_i1.p1 TRINITY_DN32171_c0_g1~~TRINITY_DN32171_c0_g1_i1.p1  ORF type:complete len:116 (+),score=8.84 TRINITY_DN32171_c0_g1_i1:90-437(+)